jgi:hypothetical protein
MKDAVTTHSGLVVDVNDPCLACSPDDIASLANCEQGLVEYEYPYMATKESFTQQQATQQLRDLCSVIDGERKLKLRHTHAQTNFYQVLKGSMAITEKQWCHFVLWRPHGLSIQTINTDPDFWTSCVHKVVNFYQWAVLPELPLPRYSASQPIFEPFLPSNLA